MGDCIETLQICFISVTLQSWSGRKRLAPTTYFETGKVVLHSFKAYLVTTRLNTEILRSSHRILTYSYVPENKQPLLPTQHLRTGFYTRGRVCLLCGTK
jgi:hypothetical protein